MMTRILAVDTSGPTGIIALSTDDSLREISFDECGSRPDIARYASRILEELGLEMSDLTNLAVGVGPGRFIRTRVGVSFINGLAAATRLPITPIDSLAILGYACIGDLRRIGAVREEVRGRLIVAQGLQDPDNPLFNPAMPWRMPHAVMNVEEFASIPPEAVELWAVDGESNEISLEQKYGMNIRAANVHSDAKARSLVKLAFEGVKRNRFVLFAAPQYHREAV
jgi:tRNA A37 threonylcarbamoyladenosine modification protein TsaB